MGKEFRIKKQIPTINPDLEYNKLNKYEDNSDENEFDNEDNEEDNEYL